MIGLAIGVASPAFAGTDQATLILNAPDKAGTPRNYRSIRKLDASGSGQFSAKELHAVRERTGGRPLIVARPTAGVARLRRRDRCQLVRSARRGEGETWSSWSARNA